MSAASGVTAADVDRPPPVRQGWSRERVFGWIFVTMWIAAGIGLALYLYSAWDADLVRQWFPRYADGLLTTVILVVVSTALGAILSVPIAYARMSRGLLLGPLSYGYVYFFRGTPLLAQTFLIYYGLGEFRTALETVGLWAFFREAWYCAILAFTLNTAAYQAEILRGAIESVPKGQWEGAASLGLHNLQILRTVVLPQAMIVALRPYGNEIVLMIKGSAIVAIITVYDLMGVTRYAYARTFDFQAYIWAAIIYLSIVELLRHTVDWIERRLTRHLAR
jgi:polar amino acid transport system permease protein